MSHHYTANTESVTQWCNKCQRATQHRVSAGRVGHCLEHNHHRKLTKKQEERQERLIREAQNPSLF